MTSPVSSRPALRPVPSSDARVESAPATRNAAAPEQRTVDVFAPAGVNATGTRPADGLKSYDELDSVQQALLGPTGREMYPSLTPKQRGVFLLITQRLERNGVDLTGLRLKGGAEGIRGTNVRFDLLFEPDPAAIAHFKASVQDGVRAGKFSEDKPLSLFHKGVSDWGVRENRTKYALQLGFGPEGAFVDMDRYNPRQGGFLNHLKHWAEILTPGNMDPFKVAPDLGEDIFSKLPPAQS
jgi:hypothetical protein